jgi:Ca2+-binding RTX toxin-like protein
MQSSTTPKKNTPNNNRQLKADLTEPIEPFPLLSSSLSELSNSLSKIEVHDVFVEKKTSLNGFELLNSADKASPWLQEPSSSSTPPLIFNSTFGSLNAFGTATSATLVTNATFNNNVDALIVGSRWISTNISFSFTDSIDDYEIGYLDRSLHQASFQAFNAIQKSVARNWLQNSYQNISTLSFSELVGASDRDATIRIAMSSVPPTAFAYPPSNFVEAGDAWFNRVDYNSPIIGGYAYHTVGHELGHTLGLKHGQESTGIVGGAGTGIVMNPDRDSMEFSIMTYHSYIGHNLVTIPRYTNEIWGFAQTLMMYDIRATQQIYGAKFDYEAGNSTYIFSKNTGEMFVNGVAQGTPGDNRIFRTIWDGNGIDTYDFSHYTTNLSVDLTPGGWSNLDTNGTSQKAKLNDVSNIYARGHVFNALQYNNDVRSLIENANGGSGNDAMQGNSANNILNGGLGNDTLNGGIGNDTLNGGDGNDQISGDAGSDSLIGGKGNDTYLIQNSIAGGTIINDSGDIDTLQLSAAISLTNLKKSGSSLLVDINGDGQFITANDLTIFNYFGVGLSAGVGFIENIQNLSGSAVLAAALNNQSIIETDGDTDLVLFNGNYVAVNPLTNSSTSILYNGTSFGPDTFPGWLVVGTEIVGSEVKAMWKTAAGQFWYSTNTNNGGNVNPGLYEVDFQQDFNNDGVIGSQIEAAGTSRLFLDTNGKYAVNNGSVDISLLYNNSAYSPLTFPGWSVIGAEIAGSEVKAIWKSTGGQFWYSTNINSGNLISNITPYEADFQQDFDSDGLITIESFGSSVLSINNGGKYVASGNGLTNINLLYNNSSYGPQSFPGWSVIAAEIVGSEVKAMWKTTAGQFWYSTNTNNGSNVNPELYEFDFKQDFNNDGFISQIGTAGNDTLGGNSFNERLTGGVDTFVLKATNNGVDYITDFATSEFLDVIDFHLASLNLLTVTGTSTPIGTVANQFIFNSGSKELYFDVDGAGSNLAVKLVTLQGVASLSTSNFKII